MISALCWRWSCSQRAGRREAVKEWGTVRGGGEQQPGEVLQGTGLVQPANPDRVVAGVGDEPPGGRLRRAVGGVEAAGPCPLRGNLAVQAGVVDVEALGDRAAGDRLDLLGQRRERSEE